MSDHLERMFTEEKSASFLPLPDSECAATDTLDVDSGGIDFDRVATVLGVDRSTLPTIAEPAAVAAHQASFKLLTDEEWAVVEPLLPKLPVPKPEADFQERTFINAVLWWWMEARARGCSWHRLPEELGPQSSREHRHRRWVMLGYWGDIADALADDPSLSEERRRAFQRIAEDAEARKSRLLEQRRRLTDGR